MKPATIVAAAVSAGLAVWLFPASVHIVSWPETGPQRVAVFAPLVSLSWALAAAVVVGLVLRRYSTLAAPLVLLGVWAIPYLPWLPDRLPVLLVLAGPVRWVVLAVVLVLIVMRRASPPTLSRRTVFVVSLLVYLALGMRSLTTIGLKGDEPHYLIISHSLLVDRDLLIENNHRRADYRSFSREELPPDYLQRGANGEIYSIHAPGLPALLLPAYALAGQYGAVATIALLAALTGLAVFTLASKVAGAGVGLLTWASIAFTVPFVPYAWSVFPEMAGAAAVAWAAVWLVPDRDAPRPHWMARGLTLALLPWLHTKFIILLAGLALLLLRRLRRQVGAASALLVPIAISLVAWLVFFYVVYGTPNPVAPYGTQARDWVKLQFVPRGVLGLLFDQKFGLLMYAPIYAVLPVGVWLGLRQQRWRALIAAITLIAVAYIVSTARFYMWWGGWSAPARFLVPVLPLAAPPLALALDRLRVTCWRAVAAVLLVISVTISAAGTLNPGALLLFSDAHGVARLFQRSQGSAPLTATLPTFTEAEWSARDLIPREYPAPVRQDIALRGRISLFEAFDPERRAFDYRTLRALEAEAWPDAARITADLRPVASPGTISYMDDHAYPEGDVFWTKATERARVLVARGDASALTIVVHIGPHGGTVDVRVGEQAQSLSLGANETRSIDADMAAGATWIPLSVRASVAFRPSDVEPASGDKRLLGCQVRVVPQFNRAR